MTSTSSRRLATTLLVCIALAAPAAAQDGLVINGRWVSAARQLGADLGPAPDGWWLPTFGGGRYAIDTSSRIITDRRTGQTSRLPADVALLALDPVRPRVFVRAFGSLFGTIAEYDVPTRQRRNLTLVGAAEVRSADQVRYAESADVLFLDLTAPAPPFSTTVHDIRAVHGTTGVDLRRLRVTIGAGLLQPATAWTATPDGAHLYTSYATSPTTAVVTAFDVVAGTEVTRAIDRPAGLWWDDVNERLFVDQGSTLTVLDAGLAPVAQAQLPASPYSVLMRVSPHTGRLYLVGGAFHGIYGGDVDVAVLDSATYASLGYANLGNARGASMSLVSVPGPPRRVSARVAGRDVALAWTNVGAASHFVLDVGVAPRRTDLSIHLGPDSQASFAGVPAGTYYLRLRGGNEFGGGRPSNEVRLVVP